MHEFQDGALLGGGESTRCACVLEEPKKCVEDGFNMYCCPFPIRAESLTKSVPAAGQLPI